MHQRLAAPEVRAGTLEAFSGAASVGSFGLRVTLGKTCTLNDVEVLGPVVNSDRLACNTITAGNVQVVSPGATFTAGDSIVFEDQFSVASGVPFTAVIDPFVDTPLAFVQNNSPSAETTYNALFDLRLDSLTLATGDDIGHFNGYSANGDLRFRAVLRRNAVLPENRLALFAWDETAGTLREHTVDFLLPGGFNGIQISWRAGADDGQFLVSINGAPLSGLTDLDNSLSTIDFVRWGAVDGTLAASSGSMDLDQFSSWP